MPNFAAAPAYPQFLIIHQRLYTRIITHLRHSLPFEGVGLLATISDTDATRRAVHFFPGTNIDRSPTRYTMDPAEVFAAMRQIADHDWQLGAIVHSHPTSAPVPSITDLRHAFYPDAATVIVSFAGPAPVARAWWLHDPALTDQPSPADSPTAELQAATTNPVELRLQIINGDISTPSAVPPGTRTAFTSSETAPIGDSTSNSGSTRR